MILQLFIQCIAYFIAIALVHYLYEYFKDTLTVPKVKDCVQKPKEEYKEMFKIIQKEKTESSNVNSKKEELKNYFKSLSSQDSQREDSKEISSRNDTNNEHPLQSFSISNEFNESLQYSSF